MSGPTDFADARQTLLRFADTVRKATSAQHLLSLLHADIEAPYHSFDLIELVGHIECIGEDFCDLLDAVWCGEELTS